MSVPRRQVGTHLVIEIDEPVRISLQVAVADSATSQISENLTALSNGRPVELQELSIPGNGRVHVCNPPPGRLEITYTATIDGQAPIPTVDEVDRIVYRRPSRYAESDRLAPMARSEFAGMLDAEELLGAISSWVSTRLLYVIGSSGPTEGAADTMFKRQGVCRDYAHLVIALLRALDVPARLAAVYAPGLTPMDFHAVAEAAVNGVWQVVDPTFLAPRSSLVRIGNGRDSADTAFLSSYGAQATLLEYEVTATVDGMLPLDDIALPVSIR